MTPHRKLLSIPLFVFGISLLFSLVYCRKNTEPITLTGNWTSEQTKTFDDLVLWTSSGKLTNQQTIKEYLQRNGTDYFSLDKTPETISGSATFQFESDYAVIDVEGETDTVTYLSKNNSLVVLTHQVPAFTFPASNTCERLIDSVLSLPSTTVCEPLPPVNNMPGGFSCLLPQYYPIETTGNQLRLSLFSFHIRSVRKDDTGQILTSCHQAASNTTNIISENLDRMLKAGDTVVTQKGFVALRKM